MSTRLDWFQLQIALRQAEEHAQHQTYEAPTELIELLKRTHYHEEAAFEVKRKMAETALLCAKDQVNVESELVSINVLFLLDGPNFEDAERLLWRRTHCTYELHRQRRRVDQCSQVRYPATKGAQPS